MLNQTIVALFVAAPLLTASPERRGSVDGSEGHTAAARARGAGRARARSATAASGAAGSPNFIAPLSKETKSGRAGAAGWSAPNPAVGSRVGGDHDNPGWPGVGFAIEWGRPERAN